MNVGLVTSWDVRCGIAEYAANLISSCSGITPIPLQQYSYGIACQYDVVHLNHEAGLFRCFPSGDLHHLRRDGKKLVLTLHNTGEGLNRNSFTDLFDRVLVHEKTQDSGNFVYMPHGIPEVPVSENHGKKASIGIAGFPFPWKGFHPTALVANKYGLGCLAIMPKSDHVDTGPMEKVVRESNHLAEVLTDWMPASEVVRRLSECLLLAFPYGGGLSGISGAVRLGLAAKRPIVLSRCRQFRDLFDYEDEIYFADEGLEQAVAQVLSDLENGIAKIPNCLLDDMAWSKVGQMHRQVYESLA